MKLGIDMGHNVRPDTGATGVRQEDDVIREVGTRVVDKLKSLGHTVIVCTPKAATCLGNSLYQRVKTANDNNVDVFASIHFNAGGGRGSEVFAASARGREIAGRVLKEIVALGFVNRGVKDGSWLYVVRNTNAPAILIECAFVDSREDMAIYNLETMANAIVEGLTGQSPVVDNPSNDEPAQPPIQEKPNQNISQEVLKIQELLNRLKITDDSGDSLAEDGLLGPKTASAIRNFQRIVGINVDGILETYTLSLMEFILTKPTVSIKFGNRTAVRYLQWRLGVKVDGIFGSNTRNAVYVYQRSNKLQVDGVVGPNTWRSLVG